MTEINDRHKMAEQLYRDHAKRHRGIFGDIVFERIRQESKWGAQEHFGDKWFRILGEEFGEIARDLNELGALPIENEAGQLKYLTNLRQEIIQTSAVCVAWLDDWDRRKVWGA